MYEFITLSGYYYFYSLKSVLSLSLHFSNNSLYFSPSFFSQFLCLEPSMDIHRCRFSEWMPSAACAVKFHPELPLLVVGRENGNIELWNTEEKWFCEAVYILLLHKKTRQFLGTRISLFGH